MSEPLLRLERRLDALIAREASAQPHREMTTEEMIEVGLIVLQYVHEGDPEAHAQFLVREYGFAPKGAKEWAEYLGVLLEERRAVGEDPSRHI